MDKPVTQRLFPLSIRELVWVVGVVVGGASGFISLGYKIDSSAQALTGNLDQQKLTLTFLEGRIVELRAHVAEISVRLVNHEGAPGHAVSLERTNYLITRIDAVERDLRVLQAREEQRKKASWAKLPDGRNIMYQKEAPTKLEPAVEERWLSKWFGWLR